MRFTIKWNAWSILAAVAAICGGLAYFIGWTALITGTTIWIETQFWFFDAITSALFAIFFLMLYKES